MFCICLPENSNGQQSKAAILALSFFCCVTRNNNTYDNKMDFLRPTSRRVKKGKSSNSRHSAFFTTKVKHSSDKLGNLALGWHCWTEPATLGSIGLIWSNWGILYLQGQRGAETFIRYSLHLKLLPTLAAWVRGCNFGRHNYNSKIPVYLRHWNLTTVI